MEIITYQPRTVRSLTLPMDEVRILPICDIQSGAKGADMERLARHVDWGVRNDCYFIGLGDYVDVASPSNRQTLSSIVLYDSVRDMMDRMGEENLKELLEVLMPTKGRWLGLVSGHHLWPFQDGTTTDTRLAQALETPYMGDAAAMTILHFQRTSDKGKNLYGAAKIWFHHGVGTSTRGVPPKLYQIAETFFAHVYLCGHVHRKASDKRPFIDYEVSANGRIREVSVNRILAACGGFLKGYELGTVNAHGQPAGSYVEKAMLAPTALGGVLLYVRPKLYEGRIGIDLEISL